jgi:tRNA wybutosine-synthesizing protein 4
MMKHFNKLQAPLHSINVYPSLGHQERRFKVWGWAHAQARSLWDLWSDDEFLNRSLRTSLDTVEAFDEWEEFALFASHYFLLIASTKQAPSRRAELTKELDPALNAAPQFTVLAQCPPGSDQRRYGALIPDSKISLGHHGGLGRQSRLVSTSLHAKSSEITEPDLPFPPRDISPRMCHTVTTLKNGDCLLVGGRTSPTFVLQDCWLRKEGEWHSTHSLPVGRFRHSAVKVTVGRKTECVLVYGGKTSDGECLDSWIVWDNDEKGWKPVEVNGQNPSGRFGACLGSINSTSGVLLGGIGPDGTVLEDFLAWELNQRGDGSLALDIADHTEDLRSVVPLAGYISRFGATVHRTVWGFAIIGGIMPRQTVPFDKEIMLLDSKKLVNRLNGTKPWSPDLVSSVGLGAGYKGPRPLLTGHVSCVVDPDQVLILGGGAVCFSFGTFWTEGTWLLKQADLNTGNAWALISETMPDRGAPKPPFQDPNLAYAKEGDISPILRVTIQTPAQFQQVVANGKPVVIEASNIGPCTELWTKEYLTDSVGSDRMVRIPDGI